MRIDKFEIPASNDPRHERKAFVRIALKGSLRDSQEPPYISLSDGETGLRAQLTKEEIETLLKTLKLEVYVEDKNNEPPAPF